MIEGRLLAYDAQEGTWRDLLNQAANTEQD